MSRFYGSVCTHTIQGFASISPGYEFLPIWLVRIRWPICFTTW